MVQAHTYFSEIHATKESQFFGVEHDIADTDEIAELRARLGATKNVADIYDLLLELGGKLDHQLRYRESIELYSRAITLRPDSFEARRARAPRLLCTLQIQRAYDDYSICNRLKPDTPEIMYRLGIAAYMLDKNSEAERLFTRCVELTLEDPEMLVASAYWLALTQLRILSKADMWNKFNFSLSIEHHIGYYNGLLVLCGKKEPEEIYFETVKSEDSLNGCIVLYALVSYYRSMGNNSRAEEILNKLIEWDDFWPAFTYLAAWLEQMKS